MALSIFGVLAPWRPVHPRFDHNTVESAEPQVEQGKEDAGDHDDGGSDARGVDEVQEWIEGGIT